MTNPVSYFEIPVKDIDLSTEFYKTVFNYEFERTEIHNNLMALFPYNESSSGISGSLAQGDSYIPGNMGTRLYFDVEDIEYTLSCAVSAGGKVVFPKTPVGKLGWVAEFLDIDGNCIALYSKSVLGKG